MGSLLEAASTHKSANTTPAAFLCLVT